MKKTSGQLHAKLSVAYVLGGLYGAYFLFVLIHVALQTPPHICGLDDGYPCGYWLKVVDLTSLLIPFTIYIMVPLLAIMMLLRAFTAFLRKRL